MTGQSARLAHCTPSTGALPMRQPASGSNDAVPTRFRRVTQTRRVTCAAPRLLRLARDIPSEVLPMSLSTRPTTRASSPLSVLVVDDDEVIRTTTHYVLADAGHSVTLAADGARALALIQARAFDVAICDVRLPKVDGMTLFRMLRREAPMTAVLVMTSHAQVKDALECLEQGAADYLTKPIDGPALLRRIDWIGARVALRRQRAQLGGGS